MSKPYFLVELLQLTEDYKKVRNPSFLLFPTPDSQRKSKERLSEDEGPLKWATSDFYICIHYYVCKTPFLVHVYIVQVIHNTVILTCFFILKNRWWNPRTEWRINAWINTLWCFTKIQGYVLSFQNSFSLYMQHACELNPFNRDLFFPTGQKGSSDSNSQDKLQHTSFCFQLFVTPLVSVTQLQYMHNQRKQLFQFRKSSVLIKCYKAQW